MRMSIHIITKFRNDALAVLLESLRGQTFHDWDLVLLDNNLGADKGEVKVMDHYLCACIIRRLQFEGHRIHIQDNSQDPGPRDIGRYRNQIIECDPFAKLPDTPLNDPNRMNEIGVRIDDDSLCEKNYLEILHAGFQRNSKIAVVGGIVPYYWAPATHAPIPAKFNEVTPGFEWTDNCINFYRMIDQNGRDKFWTETFFESGHIRSCYAYRIDIAREIKFPEWSGSTGFVEESIFCFKVWMSGYKVLINPNAIAWHIACPYGGGRDTVQTQEQMDEIKAQNLAKLKEELVAFRTAKGIEPRSYP